MLSSTFNRSCEGVANQPREAVSGERSEGCVGKTGIEIYSVNIPCESSPRCEFIAPHSVEALLGSEGKHVSVLYFSPSKCVCIHCLLSERLEHPHPQDSKSCLS